MSQPQPSPGNDGDAQRIIFALTLASLAPVVTYRLG